MDLTTISIVCGILAAAFVIRANVAQLVVGMFRHEHAAAEIESHERAEGAQKATIEALEARLELIERDMAELKARRAADAEKIAALEERETVALATLARITRQRDKLLLRVRQLTARVAELERRLTQAGIAVDDAPEEA